MDYPVAPNRWRTRAILLAFVAAVELAALVAVGSVVAGRALMGSVETEARSHAADTPAPRKHVEPTSRERPMLDPAETSVIVLNGNGVSGAAGDEAAKVKSLTYIVSGVGNAARSDYARSMVMYRKGYEREARKLAGAAGIKLVGPLDGLRTRDLMGAHLAVIVGR